MTVKFAVFIGGECDYTHIIPAPTLAEAKKGLIEMYLEDEECSDEEISDPGDGTLMIMGDIVRFLECDI